MRGNLPAVHDDDLAEYLEKLGVGAKIARGKLACFSCEEPLAIETLAAVFPDSGSVKGVCSKPACVLALVRWREEGRNG